MPLIEVKVFEDELKPEQTKDLIRRITDAVTTVTSEKSATSGKAGGLEKGEPLEAVKAWEPLKAVGL